MCLTGRIRLSRKRVFGIVWKRDLKFQPRDVRIEFRKSRVLLREYRYRSTPLPLIKYSVTIVFESACVYVGEGEICKTDASKYAQKRAIFVLPVYRNFPITTSDRSTNARRISTPSHHHTSHGSSTRNVSVFVVRHRSSARETARTSNRVKNQTVLRPVRWTY